MEDQRAPSGGTGSSEARSECQESRKEQQPENHKLECCSSLKETEEGGFGPWTMRRRNTTRVPTTNRRKAKIKRLSKQYSTSDFLKE
jgi:hypothetical protein